MAETAKAKAEEKETDASKAQKQASETRATTKARASGKKEEEPKIETVEHPVEPDPPAPLENLPAPVKAKKASGRTADGPDPVDSTALLEGHEYWSLFRSTAYVHATQMEENFFATDSDGVGHTGLAGDYLIVGVLDDVWVVPKEEFQRRFEPVTPAKA